MHKMAKNVSIIGGSDGPTSIFLVGGSHKDKNLFRRFQHEIQNKIYQYKRKKVEKSITPISHSMDQTIQYMVKTYGMAEADSDNSLYRECKRGMQFSLAQREHLELLGNPPCLQPQDMQDQEAVGRWHQALEEWEGQAQKIVDALPREVLSMDYHMFLLDKGEDGRLQIEIETNRKLIEAGFSGNGKMMDAIIKDIYRYYGVSQEDITEKTKRYQNLVTMLMA